VGKPAAATEDAQGGKDGDEGNSNYPPPPPPPDESSSSDNQGPKKGGRWGVTPMTVGVMMVGTRMMKMTTNMTQ
jgi:hypothetical protein